MTRLAVKSKISSSGGRFNVEAPEVAPEITAGVCGLVLAIGGVLVGGYPVFLADSVIAGMLGIFGAFALAHGVGLARDLHKIISILIGAGFASVFGPLVAAYAEFAWEWIRPFTYLNDAAAGLLIGLASSPALAIIRNPGPALTSLVMFVPKIVLGGRKDS